MKASAPALIHGSCIALGDIAAILQGPSGSGKSDLALRFALETPPQLEPALVADDQVRLETREGRLFASPPKTIAGKIEVRGIGIIALPCRREAEVRLLVHLAEPFDVPRLPDGHATQTISGVALPVMLLAPFEASAALKLRLALQRVASG